MLTIKDTDKQFEVEFDSWAEFVTYSASPTALDDNALYTRSSVTGNQAFCHTASIEEALKLANEGWAEGTKAVSKVSSALVDKVSYKIIRTDYVYDNSDGLFFDVARVCANEPEHWVRTEEYEAVGKSTRFVRIMLNCCVSGGIPASTITARGAAVAALVELLEYAGCRAEVVVVARTGEVDRATKGVYAQGTVLVKAFDQPLDMGRIAFALAHASMLRRMMFGIWEHASKGVRDSLGITPGGGYGRVCEVQHDEDVVYLGGAVYGEAEWESAEKAEAWCIAELKKAGVEVAA